MALVPPIWRSLKLGHWQLTGIGVGLCVHDQVPNLEIWVATSVNLPVHCRSRADESM